MILFEATTHQMHEFDDMVNILRADQLQLQYHISQIQLWITFSLELTTHFVYLAYAYVSNTASHIHIFNLGMLYLSPLPKLFDGLGA